ncbi:hypothetical protein HWV62_5429 [Athelia sp. TMB]|nr:hypothetical protein HWV62_5429 [Athelia sp. TMB]
MKPSASAVYTSNAGVSPQDASDACATIFPASVCPDRVPVLSADKFVSPKEEDEYYFAYGDVSQIWKRQVKSTGLLVAIKSFRMTATAGVDDINGKFELDLLALVGQWQNLEHHNIMPCLGVTYDFGLVASVVMPMCPEGNINDYIRDHPHASKLGLKNIVVAPNGRPLITDTGLSQVIRAQEGIFPWALPSESLRWQAPETFAPELGDAYTASSDVWSLAMTILEVMSGRMPYYPRRQIHATAFAIMDGILPLRPDNDTVSDNLWDITTQVIMAGHKSKKPSVPLKSKLKKDPGIPRLPEVKIRGPDHKDPDATMASEPTLSTLAQLASTSRLTADSDPSSPVDETQKTKEQIRRHYVRTLHKVIDQSDIVILVLDARDPEGCRSRIVEEEVRRRESEGKKLVFVLNKIDLVPRDNAQAWLRYLRHSTPTLPFRSASNTQRTHLSSTTAPALLKLLKAYKPSAAQSITVGVVGFPNVGKSSLINSLKRAKVCPVAAQPGHTKDLQSIQLERGIKVVDSPGVVFDEEDDVDGKGGKKGSVLLRNVVKVEDIDDPIAVVEEILARTSHEELQKIYNLPQFTSTLEFLTMFSLSSGRLLKGGTPDILSAARQVLTDWNHQKIPYFSATHTRIPKRQRRNKDVPDYHAPVEALSISRNNPMSRKVLKKEAKKARRDATRLHKANVGGGMDVDSDGSALQFTFMATTEGISF